jgi:hypothetical protein
VQAGESVVEEIGARTQAPGKGRCPALEVVGRRRVQKLQGAQSDPDEEQRLDQLEKRDDLENTFSWMGSLPARTMTIARSLLHQRILVYRRRLASAAATTRGAARSAIRVLTSFRTSAAGEDFRLKTDRALARVVRLELILVAFMGKEPA